MQPFIATADDDHAKNKKA